MWKDQNTVIQNLLTVILTQTMPQKHLGIANWAGFGVIAAIRQDKGDIVIVFHQFPQDRRAFDRTEAKAGRDVLPILKTEICVILQ